MTLSPNRTKLQQKENTVLKAEASRRKRAGESDLTWKVQGLNAPKLVQVDEDGKIVREPKKDKPGKKRQRPPQFQEPSTNSGKNHRVCESVSVNNLDSDTDEAIVSYPFESGNRYSQDQSNDKLSSVTALIEQEAAPRGTLQTSGHTYSNSAQAPSNHSNETPPPPNVYNHLFFKTPASPKIQCQKWPRRKKISETAFRKCQGHTVKRG